MRPLFLAVLLAGCTSSGSLYVDVRSDLIPGIEVDSIRVTLDGEAAVLVPLERSIDLVRGVRALERPTLAMGSHVLDVELGFLGSPVASRPVIVEVNGDRAVSVLITRDCAGVECPGGGAPTDSACLQGRCVPPECTPDTPELCPSPDCTGDAMCVPDSACAVGRCLEGACFFEDGGGCAAGEFCRPERGCEPLVTGQWIELGGSGSGGGVSAVGAEARNVRVSIAPGGTPYLSWTDSSDGDRDIYLARWDGRTWSGIGGSTAPGGISNNAADSRWGGLVVESETSIHAAWMDQTEGRSVYYRHWNGTEWEELGGSATARGLSGVGTAWWPTMVLDASGAPVVAWEAYAIVPGGAVHVRRWNGTLWDELDMSGTGAGIAMGSGALVSIATDGPVIFAAWQEERAGVTDVVLRSHRASTTWSELGGSFFDSISGSADLSSRAVVASGTTGPVVLWLEETPTGKRAYLRAWSGSSWDELGGSASGDGIYPTHVPVQSARLAIDVSGRPVVAWSSRSVAGPLQVYVARWEDPDWVLLCDPAAGASATRGESEYPSLLIGADGTVHVGWEEELSPGNVEAYYRQLRP